MLTPDVPSLSAPDPRTARIAPEGSRHRAGDLAQPVAALTPEDLNREVFATFQAHPDLTSLPVVERDTPIGLINRSIFLSGYALPFHREVYQRKSCIAFMDKKPLVVDSDLPLADLGRLAVATGSKVLQDGFMVTRDGKFAGLGTGLDLLQALGDLEAQRNQTIRESIDYAKIIQGAVLATSRRELAAAGLTDQHLIWEPRDTVGGDAFFARRMVRDGRDGLFLALLDCTGHGVPGAFTAMLMTSYLGHALDQACPWEPGQVLAAVNRGVKAALGQGRADDGAEPAPLEAAADEGMDATCLWLDRSRGEVVFGGANHSLWLFHPGAARPEEIKGDRVGVGYVETPNDQVWTSRPLAIPAGTVLLAASDGIVDQIGGPRRIAFGRQRLWQALDGSAPGECLRVRLERGYQAMARYQGAEERRDDVSLLAVQL